MNISEQLGREMVKQGKHFRGRDQEYTTIPRTLWDRVVNYLFDPDSNPPRQNTLYKNPRRRRPVKQSNTDPREIRAVYGGSTYWLRKSGRDNWTLTGDGQHLAGPGSYSTMLEAFMSVAGMESKPWVMIWEERGDIAITLFLGTPDDATGSIEIAQWRDDDARQMVEDGFFKPGRQLEQSVIEYGQEMGLIP